MSIEELEDKRFLEVMKSGAIAIKERLQDYQDTVTRGLGVPEKMRMSVDYGHRSIEIDAKKMYEYYLKKLQESLSESLEERIVKRLFDGDVKCDEVKQKECPTCLNPILPDQKTHIDKGGVERHKTCAMGFYK